MYDTISLLECISCKAKKMNESIKIHKLNEKGLEVWCYDGVVLSRTPTSITLQATFDRDEIVFEGLLLKRGDRFVETFYSDRWYNIFEIYDALDDQLKGWYCNVCRPAQIEDGHVYAEDLALDLIVYPEGDWRILDEDEFSDLALSQKEREQAKGALDQLIDLARHRKEPFKVTRE
jgi:predicted RNA-binding protein associated with RNAse of E/G family